MAGVSFVARRFGLPSDDLTPKVCGLHPRISVLAVGDCAPRQTLHGWEFAEHPSRVLNEPSARGVEVSDQGDRMPNEFLIMDGGLGSRLRGAAAVIPMVGDG